MSETIDIDLKDFIDYVERDVQLADRLFPAPAPGPPSLARNLCDLAFEARDGGVHVAALIFVLLARGLVCAQSVELDDLLSFLTALDCSQELIAAWAQHAGVLDAPCAADPGT